MPEAILAFSINVGATRFDRFDSLLGSIDTLVTSHRVPPWLCSRATRMMAKSVQLGLSRVGTAPLWSTRP
eukprot:543381-Alexandrium_andersonii.AAC.1